MPVQTINQIDAIDMGDRFYCRFEATLTDGRVIRKKIRHDSADGSTLEAGVQAGINAQVKRHDASEAVEEGLATKGDADETDVRRAYVVRAFQVYESGDFTKAYDMFNRFMPSLIALGLTVNALPKTLNSVSVS